MLIRNIIQEHDTISFSEIRFGNAAKPVGKERQSIRNELANAQINTFLDQQYPKVVTKLQHHQLLAFSLGNRHLMLILTG